MFWHTIRSNSYNNNSTINASKFSSIIQDVASWLLNKSDYTCVQDVIDSGNTTDINAVIAHFNTAWTE